MPEKSKYNPETENVNTLREIFVKGQIYKDVLSKKELWEYIARTYHGELKIKQTISKDVNSFQLEIPYMNQYIILTESDTKPLKFEATLKLNRRFEFNISWEGFIDRIMKFFGKQDIETGNREFDRKYLIHSREKGMLLQMLGYKHIKQNILKNNIYLMNLEYSEKSGYHKLLTVKDRNTKRIEAMVEFIELHFSIIDFFIWKNMLRNVH